MRQSIATATSLVLSLLLLPVAGSLQERSLFIKVCQEVEKSLSSASAFHWPGLDSVYFKDIDHWLSSSSQPAACSVEPGTAEDIGKILQILGQTNTSFAVKGGGHASNPGYSSTKGVQIAMYNFNEVNYDPTTSTVEVGAGLIWDDVYTALEPYSVSVVGGRVSGVGVAGFTLGGGFSWKTNQYGLTLDNLVGFELVLPNGTVTSVTQNSYPDLFWGLKGGFNNYGVVTKFILKTYPQTEVWGGVITVTGDQLKALNNATLTFQQTVTDPKAAILSTYNSIAGLPGATIILFYDNPTAPAGIFEDFLALEHFTSDVKTRSYLDLVLAAPSNATANTRGIFHTTSVLEYTPKIMDAVLNETLFWGSHLLLQDSALFVSYDVEPFLNSIFSHAPEGSSVYPPSRAQGLLPLNIYYTYLLDSADKHIYEAARQSAAHLTAVAISDGQDVGDAALYGNYAIFDTPLERIYGGNVAKLQELKTMYDPSNVMGLAGGWKF